MTSKHSVTLMDYLKSNTQTIAEKSFDELDALTLSVASYLLFEKSPAGKSKHSHIACFCARANSTR